MELEAMPNKNINVADVSTVSLRDVYMRLCACRDFEIKLQWERAVFLTAFLIACYAGYGSFMVSVHQNGYGHFSSFIVNVIPIVFSCIGIVLSLFWILMAKGSKAWYEHYEYAIGAFAQECSNTVPRDLLAHEWRKMKGIASADLSNSIFNFKGGAYSVSKIVIAIGVSSFLLWCGILLLHICNSIFGPISEWTKSWSNWCMATVSIVLGIIGIILINVLVRCLKSGYMEGARLLFAKNLTTNKTKGRLKKVIEKQVNKKAYIYAVINRSYITYYDADMNTIKIEDVLTKVENPFGVVKYVPHFYGSNIIPVLINKCK